MPELKTYAVKLQSAMKIAGIDHAAGEQVAAITCEISPYDLLGLVQHHHAALTEITGPELPEVAVVAASDDEEVISSEELAIDDTETFDEAEETSSAEAVSNADAVAAFIADGVDEKTATALVVANGINGPDALRAKLAEPGFDCIDLAEIGKVRAEKILAIYLK